MSMYIFIVNPVSGNGKAKRAWKKVKQELDKQGVHYRSFYTNYPGHAQEIARQVAELYHDKLAAIVSVGGDGTFHEMINGLTAYPQLPVGCIPAGSGNDVTRGFRLPRTPVKAVKHLLQASMQKARQYDLGEYELYQKRKGKGRFINGVGIGFDGEAAKLTNGSAYKHWLNKFKCGGLAYVISALRLIFNYETRSLKITIDGVQHVYSDVWLVAISNIPYYAGGMKIAPKANPADGTFNLCIVHGLKPLKLLFIFGTVYFGWHSRLKEVTLLEGKNIRVESDQPMTIHADGEIIGQTPLKVSVLNKEIRIW